MTEFTDGVIAITTTKVGLWDIVKLLFGWTLHIRTETGTENHPGATRPDKTEILLIRPRWLQRKHPGAVEEPAERTQLKPFNQKGDTNE